MTNLILTINTGSSSVKFTVTQADTELRLVSGQVKQIGRENCSLAVEYSQTKEEQPQQYQQHKEAITGILDWLDQHQVTFTAVAHRLVHGGPRHTDPQLITPALLADLQQYTSWAPDHLPPALEAIAQVQERHPGLEQVACFDTFFHTSLPAEAYSYTLPAALRKKGIRKYGFHGLSCEYILSVLEQEDPACTQKKIIIAHLGNGASITAVQEGKSIDTTMGLTPTGGLIMSSRTGDLDPAVILHLQQQEHYSVEETDDLIHHQSGLKGISGISSDLQELLEQAPLQPAAQQAIDLFCYQARKHLGALIATLNGIDILVFTGGAGEKAPLIRQKICAQMTYAGIRIDLNRNEVNHSLISHEQDAVAVKVITTDEEIVLVRHAARLLHHH
jgi:acetate kinase